MRNFFTFILLVLCKFAVAQLFLEPSTGISIDLGNKHRFLYVNSGLQIAFPAKYGYEFVLGISRSSGLTRKGYDSSFTLNNSLPLYKPANKRISPSVLSFYTNQRLPVSKSKTGNLYINFLLGITEQRINVAYDYDTKEYSVLNPETSIKGFGLFIGGGAEYIYQMKNGRLFFQANLVTKPFTSKPTPFNTFGYSLPLSINIGYSINLKKKTSG